MRQILDIIVSFKKLRVGIGLSGLQGSWKQISSCLYVRMSDFGFFVILGKPFVTCLSSIQVKLRSIKWPSKHFSIHNIKMQINLFMQCLWNVLRIYLCLYVWLTHYCQYNGIQCHCHKNERFSMFNSWFTTSGNARTKTEVCQLFPSVKCVKAFDLAISLRIFCIEFLLEYFYYFTFWYLHIILQVTMQYFLNFLHSFIKCSQVFIKSVTV